MGVYAEDEDEPDIESAKRFFKRGADLGEVDSQLYYAKYMEEDDDYESAWKYYRMAADQGNDEAQLALYRFCKHGYYEDADDELALIYLKKSAQNGNADAHYKLAKYYLNPPISPEYNINLAFEHATYAAHRRKTKAIALLARISETYVPPTLVQRT